MKRVLLFFVLTTFLFPAFQQEQNAQSNSFNFPEARKLPLIKVNGSKFVNEQGDTILFRGLAISDPDKVESQGYWNKNHFEKVKETGAMIVRIPVHPAAWRSRTPAKYLELLDQAVEWCTELDLYVMIDWHSIGNMLSGLYQDPMYNTTYEETTNFWRIIAARYKGINTIVFYELFNEPTNYFGQLGPISWDQWKKINEDLISIIRAYDKETIPLVAAFDWAYDLTPLLINPVQAENIGYVTHPYPNKRSQPWEPRWDENFGFAAEKWPVVATEFGFTEGTYGLKENEDYGNRIISYLESKGISWMCWVYDPEWFPMLIKSWNTYELTESGTFFKRALNGEIKGQLIK